MARREPFLAIARSIAERAHQSNFDPNDPAKAAEQMSLWYYALYMLEGFEVFEPELLLLMREILRQGFDYLARSKQSLTDDKMVIPFKDIVVSFSSAPHE